MVIAVKTAQRQTIANGSTTGNTPHLFGSPGSILTASFIDVRSAEHGYDAKASTAAGHHVRQLRRAHAAKPRYPSPRTARPRPTHGSRIGYAQHAGAAHDDPVQHGRVDATRALGQPCEPNRGEQVLAAVRRTTGRWPVEPLYCSALGIPANSRSRGISSSFTSRRSTEMYASRSR